MKEGVFFDELPPTFIPNPRKELPMNSQLIRCQQCKKKISANAPDCPICGDPDPFGRIAVAKAQSRKKNIRCAKIFFALAFLSFVFIVIPIGKVIYDKFTQNGKIPIHFISPQLKFPQ